MEKWSSRCGWDGEEWDGWYQNAIQQRKMEFEFWEKAQERVVREKSTKKVSLEGEKKSSGMEVQGDVEVEPKKEKRKNVFKRMFRRNSVVAVPVVAVAAT